MIPRWLAPLDLTGREYRVLLVIASHARKASREPRPDGVIETTIARIGIERIADEANLDRRNVQRAIRQLEAKGILERRHGGGRGRSNEYQVIFKRAADAINSVDDDAVSDADDDTGNSVVFGRKQRHRRRPYRVKTERENRSPFGGVARARGGGFFE
jgi:DNA-binding transcriptional MocR family regulator